MLRSRPAVLGRLSVLRSQVHGDHPKSLTHTPDASPDGEDIGSERGCSCGRGSRPELFDEPRVGNDCVRDGDLEATGCGRQQRWLRRG
jgi:hypothetical protein